MKVGLDQNLCAAEYAILEILEGQPNLTFKRITYALKNLELAVLQSGMPEAKHYLDWL
jgi:hypothetical protein